jgi:protein disulfide-isomerase A1
MAPVAVDKPQQLRRLLPLIALALVLPGCLASGGGEPAIFQIPRDGSVVELDEGNFEAAVAAVDYLFVDFHAPWCGHCKRLAPQVPYPPPFSFRCARSTTTAVR